MNATPRGEFARRDGVSTYWAGRLPMPAGQKPYVWWCAAVSLAIFLAGCATGPEPLKPGTPAFYWAAARETYRAGDYLKTNDNLSQLTKSDNEFTARARLWEMVTASGIAQGNIELADIYDLGARANRANPTPFRRQASMLRTGASAAALQFAEVMHRFQAGKEPVVEVAFEYPGGSAAQPAELKKITSGIVLQESEAALVQRAMVQRGVLKSLCRAMGAPDDPPKVLEMFKSGKPEAKRDVLRLQMAVMLHDQAQLFGPTKLDQPNRVKMLCGEATEILQGLPPSKQSKDLTAKIQATLKKSRVN
jgi:hypothetical protein